MLDPKIRLPIWTQLLKSQTTARPSYNQQNKWLKYIIMTTNDHEDQHKIQTQIYHKGRDIEKTQIGHKSWDITRLLRMVAATSTEGKTIHATMRQELSTKEGRRQRSLMDLGKNCHASERHTPARWHWNEVKMPAWWCWTRLGRACLRKSPKTTTAWLLVNPLSPIYVSEAKAKLPATTTTAWLWFLLHMQTLLCRI